MNFNSKGIYLTKAHLEKMEADVRDRVFEEACGLLLGKENHCNMVIPVTNILHSPNRFRMKPEEQLNAFILAEKSGFDILAVYHSHPQGVDKPSLIDIEELTYPGIIYLIWYSVLNRWKCRGYFMDTIIDPVEVPIIIEDIM